MLTNMKGIIFDLDGSLVDSMWIWPAVDEIYMEKYQLEMPEGFQSEIEGMSYDEVAQYFLDVFPQLSCTIEEVKQEWMDMTLELYATKVPLKTGARELLKYAKRQGIRLGIATSNARALAEAALHSLHVKDYFHSICTASEVNAGKPAPDVFLKAAEDMQVAPEYCLVFEDVPKGILAGKNAGMKVCAVEDEFTLPVTEEKRRLADYYIKDYYEVLKGIK